ncbi:hypothetical protein [Micromonospora sp. DH14]|uniref:hypothetical protein n=1 Tax=Micromonospora TaxID=1873 RepID=UPI00244262F5|nr:hypothetical protein [Micromonospora sp. DH14]MDG9674667.1 hypothetical protein [Micromonospora sp. DH14]
MTQPEGPAASSGRRSDGSQLIEETGAPSADLVADFPDDPLRLAGGVGDGHSG